MKEIKEDPQKFDTKYEKVSDVEENDAILGVWIGPLQKKSENKNKRVYGEQFWNHIFNETNIKERLERKTLVGRLDHPDDDGSKNAKISPSRVSHSVTDLWTGDGKHEITERYEQHEEKRQEGFNDDDLVYGRFEVYNTEDGRKLHNLLEAGVQVGQSSRALVKSERKDGKEFVTEGRLEGWDAVFGPSVEEAQGFERTEVQGEPEIDWSNPQEDLQELKDTNENAKVLCEALNLDNQGDQMSDEKLEEKEESEDTNRVEELESKIESMEDENDELKNKIEEKEDKIEDLEEKHEKAEKEADVGADALSEFEEYHQSMKENAIYALEEVRDRYQGLKERSVDVISELKERVNELQEQIEDSSNEEHIEESADDGELERLKKEKEKAVSLVEVFRDEYKALEEASTKVVNEMEDEKEDLEDRWEEQFEKFAIKLYADNCLVRLNREEDEDLRKHLESSESIEEVKRRYAELEEMEKAMKEGLPVSEVNRKIEAVIEDKEPKPEAEQKTLSILENC